MATRQRRFILATLWAVTATTAAVADPRSIDPSSLGRSLIEGRVEASTIFEDRASWTYIVGQIANGEGHWVAVAKALRRTSDGSASSELHDAMFRALSRHPATVLASAEPEFPIDVLCTGRSEPLATRDEALSEQRQTIKAVQTVGTEALRAKANLCVAQLRAGLRQIDRFFAKRT